MSEQLIQTPGVFGENGNFVLERELGLGGMGGVYMGRDKMLDRPVAVKVMLKEFGDDPEFIGKFKKEAQAAAKLIHPNIAQIYSYGICNGLPYIAMELAAGGSLYSIMQASPGKADITRVVKICQQTAQALQCSTDQGFVHGDVKPENILLDANGNAKLVDFGLAAMQSDTDEIWGTPYYISPEKVKKEPIDFRADMYSLGGTLYHALTGVAPFEGDDSIEVVKKRFSGMPKKPSEIRSEITPAIDELVMKMLAFNKEDRYPSFESLLEAFKHVLSTGLTAEAGTTDEVASAPVAKPKTATANGTRRMTVRGRRTTMMTRKTIRKKLDGDEESAEATNEESEKKDSGDEDEDEEGKGGSLGLKVVGVVVGVIALVGAVIGGLIWYQVADKKARENEERQQIVAGITKARSAISDTVANATKFANEFETFAMKAIEECEKPTAELKKILPADEAALLKPGPSKELLEAIAATNEVAAAPAPTPAAAPAVTNATAAATATNAAPAKAAADKKDANKPDAKKDAKKEEKAAEPTAEAKPEAAAPTSQVVISMNELWERAYGCQASAVRIRHEIRKVVRKGAEAESYKEETRENMEKLAELSRSIVEMLDIVKTSKDVENVKKGITYIKTKGEKTVAQTVKELRIRKLEADRKAKAEAAAAAEKERLERQAEEKKAHVEEEIKTIKDKFELIVAQGCIRQLDWKSAIRQLETVKADFKTSEGQLAADIEIRKVNDMKAMHDIFIKHLKGHVFRGKLKGARVESVNEKEMTLVRTDAKGKKTKQLKIQWQKFYKDYPGNLNEIINIYIVNGRANNAKVKLNLRDWTDAMTGAALTMQLVCGEVNGAIEKAEKLAQEAVKAFPEYRKTAQEIFPEIKFAEAEE